MNVTEECIAFWDPHSRDVNERFENPLQSNPDYVTFRGKMFFVWNNNVPIVIFLLKGLKSLYKQCFIV